MVKGNYQQVRPPTKDSARLQLNAFLLRDVLFAQWKARQYRRILEL
jgi:hypothetical protein